MTCTKGYTGGVYSVYQKKILAQFREVAACHVSRNNTDLTHRQGAKDIEHVPAILLTEQLPLR